MPNPESMKAHRLNAAIGKARWIEVSLLELEYLQLITEAEASNIRSIMRLAVSRRYSMCKKKPAAPAVESSEDSAPSSAV